MLKEERVGATPETEAKQRTNFLLTLSEERQQAACAVNDAFSIAWRGLLSHASSPERVEKGKTELSPAQRALIDAYGEWRDEATRKHRSLEATMAIIVDGYMPGDCDRMLWRKPGTSAGELLKALDTFSTIYRRWRSAASAA